MSDIVKRVKIKWESDVGDQAAGARLVQQNLHDIGTVVGEIEQKMVTYAEKGKKQQKIVQTAIIETKKELHELSDAFNAAFTTEGRTQNLVREVKALGLAMKSDHEAALATLKLENAEIKEQLKLHNDMGRILRERIQLLEQGRRAHAKEVQELAANNRMIEQMTSSVIQNQYQQFLNQTNAQIAKRKEYANSVLGIEQKLADDVMRVQSDLKTKLDTYINEQVTGMKSIKQVGQYSRQSTTAATGRIDGLAEQAQRDIAALQASERMVNQAIASINNYNSQAAQSLERRLQIEKYAYERNGGEKERLVQAQAYREEDIHKRLASIITEIQKRIADGAMTSTEAIARMQQAYARSGNLISQTRSVMEQQWKTLDEGERKFQSFGMRILEAIGIYRAGTFALNSFLAGLRSIPATGIEMQSTTSALHASFSNNPSNPAMVDNARGEALTTNAMKMLREEADRTGISLLILERNYRTFLASATMSGESINTAEQIFKGLNTTMTALHMTGDKVELTFLAIAQMFNKGKIQSEELVKQLGNLLPGAFAAFATANGKSTEQLIAQMHAGTVRAHETISKFIDFYADRYAGSFAKAAMGLNANLGRLDTAWTNFSRSLFIVSEQGMTSVVRSTTEFLQLLTPTEEGIQKVNGALEVMKMGLIAIAGLGSAQLFAKIVMLLGEIRLASFAAFSGTPFGALVTGITAVTVALIGLKTAFKEIDFKQLSPQAKLTNIVGQLNVVDKELEDQQGRSKTFISEERKKKIAELQKKRENLWTSYTAILEQMNSDEAEKAKEGRSFNEATTKNLEELRRYTHPEEVQYNKMKGILEQIRAEQRKLPSHIGDGFVAAPEQGMTKGEYDEALAKMERDRNAPKNKQIAKEITDVNRSMEQAYTLRKELLGNATEDISSLLDQENRTYADRQQSLQSALKGDTVTLNTYYASQEGEAAAHYERVNALLTKKLSLYEQSLAAEKEALGNLQDQIPSLGGSAIVSSVNLSQVDANLRKYADYIRASAERNKVPEALIYAMMGAESSGAVNAVSKKQASGLMQVMPDTYRANMGTTQGLFDPASNIEAGTRQISKLVQKYEGQADALQMVIAAYNVGETGLQKEMAKAAATGRNWQESLNKETKDYLPKVLANLQHIGVDDGKIASYNKLSTAVTASSKRILQSEGEVAAVRRELAANERERQAGEVSSYQSYIERIAAITQKYEHPDEVMTRELAALDQLKEGYNGIKLPMHSYMMAKAEILKQHDEAIKKIEREADKHAALNQILKDLNRETNRASMSDKELFMSQAYDKLLEDADKYALSLTNIEQQMNQVSVAYDRMVAVKQWAGILDGIKSGIATGFRDVLRDTKSFGESFKSIFDGFVDNIINNSLQNLWTGFQEVFNDVAGGWKRVTSNLFQLGVAALTTLLTSASKKRPDSSAMGFAGSTPGLSAFKGADIFGRGPADAVATSVAKQYSDSLQKIASIAYQNSSTIVDFVGILGTKLQASAAGQYLGEVISPVGSALSSTFKPFLDFFTDLKTLTTSGVSSISSGIDKAMNLLGMTSGIVTAGAGFTPTMSVAMANSITPSLSFAPAAVKGASAAQAVITPNFASEAAQQAAGLSKSINTLSAGAQEAQAVMGKVTIYLAVLTAGYNIVTAAMDKNSTLGTKVANSLYAVSDAMVSVGLAQMATVAGFFTGLATLVAAAFVNVAGSFTEMIDGDLKHGLKRFMFGMFADILPFGQPRTPNSWMVAENNGGATAGGKVTQTAINKGSHFYTDTPLGNVQLSYHEIPRKTDMSALDNSFKQLLGIYYQTNVMIADSLNTIDTVNKESGKTVSMFLASLSNTAFKVKQELAGLDTADMSKLYYADMASRLGSFGTVAGQIYGTLYRNLSNALVNLNPNDSVYAARTAQLSAVMANLMKELPVTVIDNLTKILTAPGKGGGIEDVLTELQGNLKNYSDLMVFSETQLGTTVSGTKVSEWIVSWKSLGLEIVSASQNWMVFLDLFKKANSGMASSDLIASGESYFASIIERFMGKGFTKAQSYTLAGNSSLGARQLSSLGVRPEELLSGGMAFAEKAALLAKKDFDSANEAIDAAILKGQQEKLLNAGMSREAMISTLVRTNALTQETVAQADFSVQVAKTTQSLLEGSSVIAQISWGLGASLEDLGISSLKVADAVEALTTRFGDAKTALSKVGDFIKTFFGETASRKYGMNQAYETQADILRARPGLAQYGLTAGMDEAALATTMKALATRFGVSLQSVMTGAVKIFESVPELDNFVTAAQSLTQLSGGKNVKDMLKASDLAASRVNASDFAKQLYSWSDGLIETVKTAVDNGASYSEAFHLISNGMLEARKQLLDARKALTDTFDGIFKTITNARASLSDRILTLQGKDVNAAKEARANAMLKSTVFDTQMEGFSLLQEVIESRYDLEIEKIKEVKSIIDDLLVDSKLSPLNNLQRMQEAGRQFQETLVKAKNGDKDALSALQGKVTTYLGEAKDYFASSPDYARIFGEVTTAIEGLGVDGAKKPEQLIADATQRTVSELQRVNLLLTKIEEGQRGQFTTKLDELNTAFSNIVTTMLSTLAQYSLVDGPSAVLNIDLSGITLTETAKDSIDEFKRSVVGFLSLESLTETDRTKVTSSSVDLLETLAGLIRGSKLTVGNMESILSAQTEFRNSIAAAILEGKIPSSQGTEITIAQGTLVNSIGVLLSKGTIPLTLANSIYTLQEGLMGSLMKALKSATLSDDAIAIVRAGTINLLNSLTSAIGGGSIDQSRITQFSTVTNEFIKSVMNPGVEVPSDLSARYQAGITYLTSVVDKALASGKYTAQQYAALVSWATALTSNPVEALKDPTLTVGKINQIAEAVYSLIDKPTELLNLLGINVSDYLTEVSPDLVNGSVNIIQTGVTKMARNVESAVGNVTVDNSPIYSAVTGLMTSISEKITLAQNTANSIIANAQANTVFANSHTGIYPMPVAMTTSHFRNGGAFTNSVVTRPTAFNEMGEAGPEGILPLAEIGGKLGVNAKVSSSDNSEVVSELRNVVKAVETNAEINSKGQKALWEQLEAAKSEIETLNRRLERVGAEL